MSKKIPGRSVLAKKETRRDKSPRVSPNADATDEELSGDRKEAMLEALPESARAAEIPPSSGRQATELPPEDDDSDDGRNESAQLAEKGVIDAEDDQARQANARAAQRDRRGA